MIPTTQTRRASTEASGIQSAVRFVAGRYRLALTVMVGFAFLGGVIEAVFLVLVTRTAFAVTDGDDQVGVISGWTMDVNQALALGVVLVVARVAFSSVAVWQSARVSALAVARLRVRLARAFLDSAWEVQQTQQAGSLQELVGGPSNQASGVLGGLSAGLVGGANLVAMLALAVAIDPVGAIVMLAAVLVFSLLLRPLRSAVRRRARASNTASVRLGTAVNEISQLGMELHVFHVQDSAADKLGRCIESVRQEAQRLQTMTSMSSTAYGGLAFFALLAALGFVSASNATSVTSLGAVMLVMLRSLSYGQATQAAYMLVSSSAPAIDKVVERLEYFEDGRRHDGGQPVSLVGPLVVDQMSFAYPGDEAVLHDVSFEIEPGEVVGVVGPSGGGKSTLVQLLLGLRDPQAGRILADGRDIRGFDKAEWARKVAFVPQSAHLIAGSVADNIRFFRDGVSNEEVEKAARLAHLHEDVIGFPEQYERSVGELGGHLSGGQQQRLCIARALVEEPDVLILDEPTSALDVKSEYLIRTTLLDLKERMTVIIIAHRLSTLDICDRIMVIQNGRLIGFDTPDRLESSSDFYREALHLSGLR